jgi:hypothetical protein
MATSDLNQDLQRQQQQEPLERQQLESERQLMANSELFEHLGRGLAELTLAAITATLALVVVVGEQLGKAGQWTIDRIAEGITTIEQHIKKYLETNRNPPTQVLERIANDLGTLEKEMRDRGIPGAGKVSDLRNLVVDRMAMGKSRDRGRDSSAARSNEASGAGKPPDCQTSEIIKQAIETAVDEALQKVYRDTETRQREVRNSLSNPQSFTVPSEQGNLTGQPESGKNPQIQAQNKTAKDLANLGYNVEQLPPSNRQQVRVADYRNSYNGDRPSIHFSRDILKQVTALNAEIDVDLPSS